MNHLRSWPDSSLVIINNTMTKRAAEYDLNEKDINVRG